MYKYARLGFLCVTLVLSGCASHAIRSGLKSPAPFFTSDIIVVPENESGKYWVRHQQRPRFPRDVSLMAKDSGCAKIKFIIDSNGNVFNPVAVKVVGGKWYELLGLAFLDASTFTPAKGNSRHIPIETFATASAVRRPARMPKTDPCNPS